MDEGVPTRHTTDETVIEGPYAVWPPVPPIGQLTAEQIAPAHLEGAALTDHLYALLEKRYGLTRNDIFHIPLKTQTAIQKGLAAAILFLEGRNPYQMQDSTDYVVDTLRRLRHEYFSSLVNSLSDINRAKIARWHSLITPRRTRDSWQPYSDEQNLSAIENALNAQLQKMYPGEKRTISRTAIFNYHSTHLPSPFGDGVKNTSNALFILRKTIVDRLSAKEITELIGNRLNDEKRDAYHKEYNDVALVISGLTKRLLSREAKKIIEEMGIGNRSPK